MKDEEERVINTALKLLFLEIAKGRSFEQIEKGANQ